MISQLRQVNLCASDCVPRQRFDAVVAPVSAVAPPVAPAPPAHQHESCRQFRNIGAAPRAPASHTTAPACICNTIDRWTTSGSWHCGCGLTRVERHLPDLEWGTQMWSFIEVECVRAPNFTPKPVTLTRLGYHKLAPHGMQPNSIQ